MGWCAILLSDYHCLLVGIKKWVYYGFLYMRFSLFSDFFIFMGQMYGSEIVGQIRSSEGRSEMIDAKRIQSAKRSGVETDEGAAHLFRRRMWSERRA
jgi:hypothetical protein